MKKRRFNTVTNLVYFLRDLVGEYFMHKHKQVHTPLFS